MNHRNESWSRKKFITTITGAGAALVLNPFTSWTDNDIDAKVKRIVAKSIGIDTHNHMDMPFSKTDFEGQSYNLASEMSISGFRAISMTFSVDRPNLEKEGEAFERFITTMDEMDIMLNKNRLSRALNYSNVKKAHRENRLTVVQSVEGAHFIEGKMERLQMAYDRGLRHLGLMHDGQTSPPMGDIYTEPPQFGGLTSLGKDVITECNRLGILLDLAHCSNAAIDMALETSTDPMLISHTGLDTQLGTNEKTAKMMMPRLISKEQAKKFAGAGGVIGVWTHLADTPLDYAKNVKALVDVVGSEHVCIGTDTKMAIASTLGQQFGKKTNQSWENEKNGFLFTVVEAFIKTGFTEKEIIQISGGNYWRIFDQATKLSK